MKKSKLIFSAAVVASAMLGIGVASAADLPARLPAKAPVYVAPPFSWTGFYIGANAGYHSDSDRASTAADPVGWTFGAVAIDAVTPGTVHPSGFTGGGQIGFNWQMNSLVWGIEADASWMGGTATRAVTGFGGGVNPADVFTTTAQSHFFGTLRPRVGLAVDRALFYVTGGLAVTDAKFTDSFGFFGNNVVTTVSDNTTRVGWTAGVGIEYAFTNNWSVKAEYLYADLGNFTQSIPTCVPCGVGSDISVTHRYTENIGRVGLNYKFDWAGPVVAKY